jgi:hypothetical protein
MITPEVGFAPLEARFEWQASVASAAAEGKQNCFHVEGADLEHRTLIVRAATLCRSIEISGAVHDQLPLGFCPSVPGKTKEYRRTSVPLGLILNTAPALFWPPEAAGIRLFESKSPPRAP